MPVSVLLRHPLRRTSHHLLTLPPHPSAFVPGGATSEAGIPPQLLLSVDAPRVLSSNPVASAPAETSPHPPPLPLSLPPPHRVTPLVLSAWTKELQAHPDKRWANSVLDYISQGARVGFTAPTAFLRSASRNMLSALQQPQVIDEYLANECREGRVAGPFSSSPYPSLHINRFGVVPKRSAPGSWRLILDLSHPPGASVNDGIPQDPFSMQYVSVDDAIRFIIHLGRGALLAKLISHMRIVSSPFIRKTVPFWVCVGGGNFL